MFKSERLYEGNVKEAALRAYSDNIDQRSGTTYITNYPNFSGPTRAVKQKL